MPAHVLLVSGGHTQLLKVDSDLSAEILAQTADDAAGECFDKSAKLMGLTYPGGPAIEQLADTLPVEDEKKAQDLFKVLPKPKSAQGFSFSGLKTAIRIKIEKNPELKGTAAFAWAVQETIGHSILNVLKKHFTEGERLFFCGGVSANRRIRHLLLEWCESRSVQCIVPSLKYCTDNAAMIGAAAWIQNEKHALNKVQARVPLS